MSDERYHIMRMNGMSPAGFSLPERETQSELAAPAGSTAKPQRWKITRIIKETYEGWGDTAEDAIEWLNTNSGGAGTVEIQKETAVKVKQ